MVIILGPTGAGKSLQSQLLVDKGHAHWISIGKLLRENLPTHKHELLKDGTLIDLKTVTGLIENELRSIAGSELVLLDGFPRSDEQMEWLFSSDNPRKLDGVIVINIDAEEVHKRLKERGRPGDSVEKIKSRLEQFYSEIDDIRKEFQSHNVIIVEVDGKASIEVVNGRILEAMRQLAGQSL